MGWPRRSRDDRDLETLPMDRRVDGRQRSSPTAHAGPAEHRERTDSYCRLVLGLVSPFLLAVPVYPLA